MVFPGASGIEGHENTRGQALLYLVSAMPTTIFFSASDAPLKRPLQVDCAKRKAAPAGDFGLVSDPARNLGYRGICPLY